MRCNKRHRLFYLLVLFLINVMKIRIKDPVDRSVIAVVE